MRSARAALRAALLLVLLLAPGAAAHGGRAQPGDTLERATLVAPPARLFEEDVTLHYYRVELREPMTLRVRVAAPTGAAPDEPPLLVVFGPGLPAEGIVPPDVERPPEGGVVSFVASDRLAQVEPRLGARWLVLLERELALEAGTHHLVLRSAAPAPLALLLDAPATWWVGAFVLPLQRDEARVWSGAPAYGAPVAALAALALVGALAWRRRRAPWTMLAIGAYVGGAMMLASAFALALDAWRVRDGAVAGWAAACAGCAALALVAGRASFVRPFVPRALLLASGVAGLAVGAGALWGPVIAIVATFAPEPAPR